MSRQQYGICTFQSFYTTTPVQFRCETIHSLSSLIDQLLRQLWSLLSLLHSTMGCSCNIRAKQILLQYSLLLVTILLILVVSNKYHYGFLLHFQSFPSAMNLPTITTQSFDDLIGQGGKQQRGNGSEGSDEPPKHNWTTMTPQEIATWIDKRSRIMFPLLFIVFNILYWTFVYCL